MSETLTYVQGLILRILLENGESRTEEIASELSSRLQKDCALSSATIKKEIFNLTKEGYIAFSLTEKGRDYIKPPVANR